LNYTFDSIINDFIKNIINFYIDVYNFQFYLQENINKEDVYIKAENIFETIITASEIYIVIDDHLKSANKKDELVEKHDEPMQEISVNNHEESMQDKSLGEHDKLVKEISLVEHTASINETSLEKPLINETDVLEKKETSLEKPLIKEFNETIEISKELFPNSPTNPLIKYSQLIFNEISEIKKDILKIKSVIQPMP
jgi:hypothetical protein